MILQKRNTTCLPHPSCWESIELTSGKTHYHPNLNSHAGSQISWLSTNWRVSNKSDTFVPRTASIVNNHQKLGRGMEIPIHRTFSESKAQPLLWFGISCLWNSERIHFWCLHITHFVIICCSNPRNSTKPLCSPCFQENSFIRMGVNGSELHPGRSNADTCK